MVLDNAGDTRQELVYDFFTAALFSFVVTFSIFLANAAISKFIVDRLEGKTSASFRIFVCMIFSVITANLIIYIVWLLFNRLIFHEEGLENRARIFENQVLATVLVIIVSLIFEIKHYISKLRISIAEKEKLEKENIKSQLESLRNQVNPHFLFNSFNALQSLIDTDTVKAKEFVQELSKVYRYVLEHKDEFVVELKEEINFIHSFIYLNKIRFGENIKFTTSIEGEILKKFIPPLTLQLLVENAIKHNVISSDKPLHIDIVNENGSLLVKNNLQLRTEKIMSTGIGLQNLKERYQLIYHISPEFLVLKDSYVAKIPLIEKEMN
ncbi:MAG: histidine kinase [Chitinophagales bacterium]|nr:histidine kinase [Chitinophagales bacterium]